MRWELESKKPYMQMKPVSFVLMLIILGLIVTSCGKQENKNVITSATLRYELTHAFTRTPTPSYTRTPTPSVSKTQKPTQKLITAIPTATYDFYRKQETLAYTQGPILISTDKAPGNEYLYKFATVAFTTPWRDGANSLNLDNLLDNGPANSDIEISHSTGSAGIFYNLFAVNNSVYYFSDQHGMTYDSCLAHYPFTNMDSMYYIFQSDGVPTGRDYCVITNENRLSIVRVVLHSKPSDANGNDTIYVIVTTFAHKIPDEVLREKTPTPGPTPTPSNYTGYNLTDSDIKRLDRAGQSFFDAVKVDDRKAVAKMLEYPFTYSIGTQNNVQVENEEEFLSAYSLIFTPGFVKELSQATLTHNMGGYLRTFVIWVEGAQVFFHKDGTIYQIYRDENL